VAASREKVSAASPLLVLEKVRVALSGNVVLALDHFEIGEDAPGLSLLMGPNGAGKTTLLNAVTGYVKVARGAKIFLRIGNGWNDLTGRSPDAVLHCGVARTFQTPPVFPSLTVRESMLLAGLFGQTPPWYNPWQRLRLRWQARPAVTALVQRLLQALRLESVADSQRGPLSLALLRRVELACCLAAQPRLLFLDEPTAGADHDERDMLVRFLTSGLSHLIGELNKAGLYVHERIATCVITHDLPFTRLLREANPGHPPFVHVLNLGSILVSQTLDKVMEDPALQQLYLGVG
jgi:ABC-type branched-subunit amino acid transport system ATPase component